MNQDIRVPVNVNRLPFMTKVKSALGPEGAYCYILLHCLAGEQFFSGTFENLSAEELEGLVGWRGVKGELVRVLVDLGELKNGATGYHLARWVSWNSYAASFPIRSLTGRKNRIKGWKIKRGVLQEKQEDDSEPTREPNREPTRLPYSPIPTPTPTPVGGEEGREESSSNSFEFDSPPPEQSREGGEVGLALKGLPSSPSVSVMQKNPAQDDTFVERHVATLVDTLVAKHGDGIGTEVQRLLDAGVDMKKLHYALSFISLPDSGKLNRPPLVRLHAELKERGVDVQALGGGMPREVEDADVPF